MSFIGYCANCKARVKVKGNNAPSVSSSTLIYFEGSCPICSSSVKSIREVPKFGGKWRV